MAPDEGYISLAGSISNSIHYQQTSLTDTGATGRLVANQREVMTSLLELLYVLNIKRNIF